MVLKGTEAEYQSDAGSTKDTPYLNLMGDLRGVLWIIAMKLTCYNGTALCVISGH